MVHHSLTKDGETADWPAIRKYHTSWRYNGKIITEKKAEELKQKGKQGVIAPWRDIGYHYGIERIGDNLEVMLGRDERDPAAACKEARMNERAIHICCVGNFDEEPPSDDVLHAAARLIVAIRKRWRVNIANVVGHTQYATYKSCPGKMFDMEKLRTLVKELT